MPDAMSSTSDDAIYERIGDRRSIFDPARFDEEYYLERNPDIAKGVEARHFTSGWEHYELVGWREGRKARERGFDEAFYLATYPLAVEEIEAGHAADASHHYLTLGRARGYLPNPEAPRPNNPAALPSRFGGFWLDQPNALDLINGKVEIGAITEAQAEQLRFWTKNGYVILNQAVPESIIDGARQALEQAHAGEFPNLLFECGAVTKDRRFIKWQAEINDHPSKALDIHFHSAAIRDAIFADAVTDFLGLVFESRALASQTLGFWRGSAQDGHQDTAYVAYTMPRNFAASWIALEDVTLGAGELFYREGSHKLDDFLYGGFSKTIHDCRRMNGGVFPHGEAGVFLKSLATRTSRKKMQKKTFAAKKGDVLIWHADLVHGGNPVSSTVTRKSVVTHYCPTYLAPLYFEEKKNTRLFRHGNHRFASGIYRTGEPGGQ